MNKPKVLIIAGPTATGKTAVSVALALRLNAEIISADSRQIYRYMDIATAKPSLSELSSVQHHFIDIINPDEDYNAGLFGKAARTAVRNITDSGKSVIVTGGSGLYIKALVDGFFGGTDSDKTIRKKIQEDIRSEGLSYLYLRLQHIDPEAASKIHPNDARRIERAVEVYEVTGRRISELHRAQTADCPFVPVFAGLVCDRSLLYERIEKRIDRMIEQDVIDETRGLLSKGYKPGMISMEGLGYREIIDYLNGESSYDEMILLFKQHSRNYAKRQITWFKKESRMRWFETGENKNQERLINSIIDYYHSS